MTMTTNFSPMSGKNREYGGYVKFDDDNHLTWMDNLGVYVHYDDNDGDGDKDFIVLAPGPGKFIQYDNYDVPIWVPDIGGFVQNNGDDFLTWVPGPGIFIQNDGDGFLTWVHYVYSDIMELLDTHTNGG